MNPGTTNGTGSTPVQERGRNGYTGEQSIPELIRNAIDSTQRLIQDEIALIKAELQQAIASFGVGVGLALGGGLFAILGLAFLGITILFALRLVMPPWLAALIVTVIYFAVGGALALMGLNRLKAASKKPAEAVENIQEDAAWIGRQIK